MTTIEHSEAVAVPIALRGRRLRRSSALRALVRETRLTAAQLIQPVFVCGGSEVRQEIGSMPGQFRVSVDQVGRLAQDLESAGLGGMLLFGIPDAKDAVGSGAWADDGVVQQALAAARSSTSSLVTMADVCLCEYTSHGHCGVLVDAGGAMQIDNDHSLDLLGRTAVSLARAGADVVAPSAMMDGQVAAVRAALDAAGQADVTILAYAAKHASAFYGPFREAAGSAPAFGDRKTYQMDPANGREALRELGADVAEGADMVMVKPALPALDIIARARDRLDVPVAAYQVSGEYAAICAAADRGWLDRRAAAMESLTAIARAGAGIIVTYFARDAAGWLAEGDR